MPRNSRVIAASQPRFGNTATSPAPSSITARAASSICVSGNALAAAPRMLRMAVRRRRLVGATGPGDLAERAWDELRDAADRSSETLRGIETTYEELGQAREAASDLSPLEAFGHLGAAWEALRAEKPDDWESAWAERRRQALQDGGFQVIF